MADSRALEEQAEREVDTAGMPQKKLLGRGKRAACGDEEAVGYGRMLAAHIGKLHGGAYHAAFLRGMSAYGNPDVPNTPVAFSSNVPEKAAMTGKGRQRMVGAGPLKLEIEHMGEGSDDEMDGGMKELMGGNLQSGRYEGEGHCEGGGTGAGKVDGRKARAAIVKKVMAEKGLKMVDASKYVKEHGLYKK